jgi:hypothetical protein
MHRLPAVVVVVFALVLSGCNTPGERLNAPPHGRVHETSDLQGTFYYMSDNALLADMTVNDMHFLPHRAALNDLGERRLMRLAALMEAYGGTLRFNTDLTDEDLIAQRMNTIMDFLIEAGIDTTHEVVTRDLPGGEGMVATEAILIKVNEGTYQPKGKSADAAEDADIKRK